MVKLMSNIHSFLNFVLAVCLVVRVLMVFDTFFELHILLMIANLT